MGLIITCIIGLIVGAIARALMPGPDRAGCIMTILLGVGGAFVGTWLGRMIGLYQGGRTAGFLMSIVGAVVILWIYRMLSRRT